mmetsp:Transcript_53095/g.147260  ORF Transcript_53095/g.147260 Transcript_53095/m.147260 type:complete len:326 (-) Transcript_53095:224-1201(-)
MSMRAFRNLLAVSFGIEHSSIRASTSSSIIMAMSARSPAIAVMFSAYFSSLASVSQFSIVPKRALGVWPDVARGTGAGAGVGAGAGTGAGAGAGAGVGAGAGAGVGAGTGTGAEAGAGGAASAGWAAGGAGGSSAAPWDVTGAGAGVGAGVAKATGWPVAAETPNTVKPVPRSASGRSCSNGFPCSMLRSMLLFRVTRRARVLASGWSRRHTTFFSDMFVWNMSIIAWRKRSLRMAGLAITPIRSIFRRVVLVASPLASKMAPASLSAGFSDRSISSTVLLVENMIPRILPALSPSAQFFRVTFLMCVLVCKALHRSCVFSSLFI